MGSDVADSWVESMWGPAQAGDPHKAAALARTANSTVVVLCCTDLVYFKEA